jgi:putative ABC transport system permease protein
MHSERCVTPKLLLSLLAGAALVLAVIGIYGVLAYLVAQRTQEIGIRMALGADRANIRSWVLKQGLLLTVSGALIGVCAAFGLTRLIASFLFGVNAWDPLVFVAVPLLLTVVAIPRKLGSRAACIPIGPNPIPAI